MVILFPLNLFLLLSFILFNLGVASAKCKDTTKCKEVSYAIAPQCSDTRLNFALRVLYFLKLQFYISCVLHVFWFLDDSSTISYT